MKMEQQRKAFDGWYSHKYSRAVSEANKEMAWQGWLAAQQQEGYVMVPVEPTEEMIDAGVEDSDVDWKRLKFAYTAMIQAAQE